MLPFKSLIKVDRCKKRAIFLQISDSLVGLISRGVLTSKSKLPGTRSMAKLLEVNRQTIVAAYDELESQGWIVVVPKKGPYVKEELPIIQHRRLSIEGYVDKIVAEKILPDIVQRSSNRSACRMVIDRGSADDRLAPVDSISRAYRSALISSQRTRYLSNIDIYQNRKSEVVVSDYLNRTRGLRSTESNVLLTQGSQMGIYLASLLLLEKDDGIVIGASSYRGADNAFRSRQARLIEVPVDKKGLDIDAIEAICQKRDVRCVYITPHHHLPTTVTLSAGRRMRLLSLAAKYDFVIIEDDYDFDYHYKSSPLLPLASSDVEGRVIYVGSMSKNLAPGIRFGYMVAKSDWVVRLKQLRTIVDRYGDLVVERAIASLIEEGEVERHLRKCLRIYRGRRDYFCHLLKEKFGDSVRFDVPDGGLAVWCEFDDSIDLRLLAAKALKRGLFVEDGRIYCRGDKFTNATRMGFASLNYGEMEEALSLLRDCL